MIGYFAPSSADQVLEDGGMDVEYQKDSQYEGAITHILVNPDAHGLEHVKAYFLLLYAMELGLSSLPNFPSRSASYLPYLMPMCFMRF